MCIRDRCEIHRDLTRQRNARNAPVGVHDLLRLDAEHSACLLYTSDAADELRCVDLGGRSIIKKKKINTQIIFLVQSVRKRP